MSEHLITDVDGIWLRSNADSIDSSADDPSVEALVVRVRTASGLTGLGECNHHPAAAQMFLQYVGQYRTSRGVTTTLKGRDPRDHIELMLELENTNMFSAARGIGRGLLSAIDTALWDLSAQIAGVPLWKLLWGGAARPPRCYCTLYTYPAAWAETQDRLAGQIDTIRPMAFRSVKVEPLVDCVPETHIGDFARLARDLLGPYVELLVDFGYRMEDSARAIRAIADCEAARPLAIETPCRLNDHDLLRTIAAASPVPLAGAELADHVDDFRLLIEAGVHILQPWPNRIGIGGTKAVIDAAVEHGRHVMLGGWNATGIGVAAGVHLAAGAKGDLAVIEHAPAALYEFPLRAAVGPALEPDGDVFALPTAPGLGVSLDPARVAKYLVTELEPTTK